MLLFDKVSNNRNLRIEIERKSSDFKHKVKIIDMRSYIIPIASALVLLSSCSVYREGQTPDDVYYSPARTQQGADYVQTDNGREDGRRYRTRDTYNGYDDYAGVDDRWLMMRVRNRSRWSLFDDYNYYSPYGSWGWGGFSPGIGMGMGFYNGFYDPYGFSYYNHFNNYWNWNSYYNPYYPNIIVIDPKTNPAGYNRLRNFNLTRYNNTSYSNRTGLTSRPSGDFRSRYNNANSNNRVGNYRRGSFQNSTIDTRQRGTYNNRSYDDRPVRTYSPSSSGNNSYRPSSSGSSGNSGSSGSGNSGGGGGSRPTRSR
jgi:uncharacterized membrane protein YgcG